MSIKIQTRLDAGIYKSSGGGETRTHHEFATGPRNLLKALALLPKHRKAMTAAYGNIGHGSSWLEIDGVAIADNAVADVLLHDADCMPAYVRATTMMPLRSPTEKARIVLADLPAHSQAAEAAALNAYYYADLDDA